MDADVRAHATPRYAPGDEPLGPYVPALLAGWLRDLPEERHRTIAGTLVFADVSGFTRMTEILSGLGKRGAEEMAELINGTFEKLLAPAKGHGADLIKWGGDATLLLFDGPGNVARACRAACEMQAVLSREGRLHTSRGSVRLRMSVGIHSGETEYLLVGNDDHRELLLVGPSPGIVTSMEKAAGPGEIVVSAATAEALSQVGRRGLTVASEGRLLLRIAPEAEPPLTAPDSEYYTGVDIGVALCRTLREHVLEGALESEHRHVTTGFVKFSGVDALLAREGPDAALVALEHSIRAVQGAAVANGVTFLGTDIDADGARVLLGSGAPRSLGHHEDRMIATAHAALDAGGVLVVRAGASSGRVFAGDYGPPYRRTYSLMGDSVNTAARLMAHADENTLLVTAPVLQAASTSYVTVAREPLRVKGKRDALLTFSVAAADHGLSSRTRSSASIIGREQELAKLRSAERRAEAGEGAVVELLGAPGIGKSRLLDELAGEAAGEVLWAQGEIYAGSRPYAPFAQLLRTRWGIGAETGPGAQAALRALARERAPHLLPWLPLIGIVAGLELPATAEVEQTDPASRRERLEQLTSELLATLLPDPCVLIFDDVHLMDEASIDLIARLAADAAERPWLLVVSRRPQGRSPVSGRTADRIELAPLDSVAADQLLARATEAAPLPPHKLTAVSERAAGNPLFLEELVAQVRAGGDPDALPLSVEGAIAARIDALAPAERRALCAAAVLGVLVEVSTLQEVLGDGEGLAARAQLEPLSEFLEPARPGSWRFSQQLVREVAYESLPYRRRAELHARTAEAIERSGGTDSAERIELLSLHCLHGARYRDAWRYSRVAAESARARYANAEAAEIYGRALAAADHLEGLDPAALSDVHEALGDLDVELGELDAADRAYRRALARERAAPKRAARLQLKIARQREICGRHTAALRWVKRAEDTLEGAAGPGVRTLRAQLAVRRARIRHRQSRYADALASALAAVTLARRSSDRRTLAEALEYADAAEMELGNPAGTRAQEALAIYTELGDLGAEARVRNTLGALGYHQGNWSAALEHYRAAESAYNRCGRPWAATISIANAAEVLVDQGRLEDAQDALERAMRVWRGVDAAANVAFGEYQLARIDARKGYAGQAMRRFESARAHFSATGEVTEVVIVDALTAECLCLASRPEEALALADRTLARARTLGGVASATPLLQRVRGTALLQLGRRDEARDAYEQALRAARSRSAGHEIAFTLRALSESGIADAAQHAAWREELARLARDLGIVT